MLMSAWVMMSMSRPWMPMETAGLPSMGLTVSNTENFTPWFKSSRLSFWMSSRLSATAPGNTMASRYWSGFWARTVSGGDDALLAAAVDHVRGPVREGAGESRRYAGRSCCRPRGLARRLGQALEQVLDDF